MVEALCTHVEFQFCSTGHVPVSVQYHIVFIQYLMIWNGNSSSCVLFAHGLFGYLGSFVDVLG